MMKSSILSFIMFVTAHCAFCQAKYERESRIDQDGFPQSALSRIELYLQDARRIRFYQETDSVKQSFEVKFKKGKLHYSVEFDEKGALEDIEFTIAKNDLPEESWERINDYLKHNFSKYRIKKIQQQYPLKDGQPNETIREAFQNLLLPYINYEFVFMAKNGKSFQMFEALFNSEGHLITLRKSFSSSYDHVLY